MASCLHAIPQAKLLNEIAKAHRLNFRQKRPCVGLQAFDVLGVLQVIGSNEVVKAQTNLGIHLFQGQEPEESEAGILCLTQAV